MKKSVGYSLLAGLAAVVVLISTAIFVGFGGDDGGLGSSSHKPRDPAAPAVSGQWVGTWSAAAAAAEPGTLNGYAGMSIRNVVHTSVGGSGVRIQLSNLYGTRPLVVSHATLALAAAPSNPTAASGTMRRLSFGSKPAVTIPAGGAVTSDPTRLKVPGDADLLVTTYSPSPSGPATYHPYARQTSYLARGDRAEDATGAAYTEQSPYWRYLTGVDVWSTQARGSVVAIGDSITDGITSTAGANHRWTDFLAARLRTEPGAPRYGVLNQGISGNRLLVNGSKFSPNNGPSVLSRLERDALSRTGVKAVIVEIGLNDLFKTPRQLDPQKIAEGMRQVVREAHARGLRVTGSTLTPFGGHRGYSNLLNSVREQVNRIIRSGAVYDEVVDFDKALRDPSAPVRLRPSYDSGDHLHPSDEGFRAMAHAVNLAHLKLGAPASL
ncbi:MULTISPECIES: SGNH/GDSL hydrolase family protein [Streptomyces]|uniref:SGNH/GDSL hydrolase family protein n=1 Tax=Streptomyces decoyicus TaxID=249567 RepID=A0ABZ1FKY3_9ACTN|nr:MULTISPECIES: SGNH/GDSL hydrolase family protein [Streptomyces]MCL7491327.1 SGNH/GDSL hydrolase family protein [Streptomyces sp. MCA2]WSB71098.1 SGNH/GDSL hydrolase family protein [Streptomyces decoyicus]